MRRVRHETFHDHIGAKTIGAKTIDCYSVSPGIEFASRPVVNRSVWSGGCHLEAFGGGSVNGMSCAGR